ncbi:MAG: hypothetical protein INR64_09680, partial [Caulobacteraceae bacterium]|nr:hypothetical protein [Caulobacter sp.]
MKRASRRKPLALGVDAAHHADALWREATRDARGAPPTPVDEADRLAPSAAEPASAPLSVPPGEAKPVLASPAAERAPDAGAAAMILAVFAAAAWL